MKCNFTAAPQAGKERFFCLFQIKDFTISLDSLIPNLVYDVSIPTDEVMEKSKMALMAIPQTDYKKCSEDWIKHWHKCVAVDGEYFKGDNIYYDE